MKIRIGFVGNSSSASFSLKINTDLKSLIKLLENDYYDNFGDISFSDKKSSLLNLLKQFIIKEITSKRNSLSNMEDLFTNDFLLSITEKEIEELEERLNNLEKLSKMELYKEIFNILYCISINEFKGYIELNWHTTMLNDYSSSIPDIIKEILLIEKIDNSIETELTVKEDL